MSTRGQLRRIQSDDPGPLRAPALDRRGRWNSDEVLGVAGYLVALALTVALGAHAGLGSMVLTALVLAPPRSP